MANGTPPRTFVLVHGACHGGWVWRDVAALLRRDGHAVLAPTLTGLGERAHLLSPQVTLETCIGDLTAVLEAEELSGVVLVGHSFAGLPISGVAERMPERIAHLVYLDSLVVEGGQCAFSVLAPEVVAERRALARRFGAGIALPPAEVTTYGIPANHPKAEWVRRRLTPHPLMTYETPLPIRGPVGNGLPRTYVACTAPAYAPLEGSRTLVRRLSGWNWLELPAGHDCMVTAPEALATLLADIA